MDIIPHLIQLQTLQGRRMSGALYAPSGEITSCIMQSSFVRDPSISEISLWALLAQSFHPLLFPISLTTYTKPSSTGTSINGPTVAAKA
jgi:hypothetical protein